MEQKINVSLRAAKLRLNRRLNADGNKLVTFRRPIDGYGHFGIIDLRDNRLDTYGDFESLLGWMKQYEVIKPYETLSSK